LALGIVVSLCSCSPGGGPQASYGSNFLRALMSAGLARAFFPKCRFLLEDFFVRMWLLLALLCRIFFFAVTLNLFWIPLWVFNFGIFSSCFRRDDER